MSAPMMKMDAAILMSATRAATTKAICVDHYPECGAATQMSLVHLRGGLALDQTGMQISFAWKLDMPYKIVTSITLLHRHSTYGTTQRDELASAAKT